MDRVLILGYGNPDRQDDGVAWHVLVALARKLGREVPASCEEGFTPQGEQPHLLFALQLCPEMAETIAAYDRVCFVDAHTGAIPHEVNWQPLHSQFQRSPFTHHMTAATCLEFCKTLYQKEPQAVLVSIRGYAFGFSHQLSPQTAILAQQAAERIWRWLSFE